MAEETKNNRRGGGYQGPRKGGGFKKDFPKPDYEHKVLDIARVTRVTKGGKRFSFRATVAAGDEKGKVGMGISQGKDLAQAVQKATAQARKNWKTINISKGTIPHEVLYKFKSAQVLLKPSPEGSGIKAGGSVRVIAQLVGLRNLTGKIISRTNNKINIARATIGGLQTLELPKSEVDTKKTEEEPVVSDIKN